MKVMFSIEVDLIAMKEEDTLENWIDAMCQDGGANRLVYKNILNEPEHGKTQEARNEKAWEQLACDVAATYFNTGDMYDFAHSQSVEIEYNNQERPDLH